MTSIRNWPVKKQKESKCPNIIMSNRNDEVFVDYRGVSTFVLHSIEFEL